MADHRLGSSAIPGAVCDAVHPRTGRLDASEFSRTQCRTACTTAAEAEKSRCLMRYTGIGNATTTGLALVLPGRCRTGRAYAHGRTVSLCCTADRRDVREWRVWRQPSNASK